jgi:small subunit ribosomal protein S16
MLKIRLKRVGRKHDPSYRIIVTESTRGPKSGKYIEVLGSYDPRFDSKQIKSERVKFWMESGAQVSPTVHNIFVDAKIIDGKKINVLPKKSPVEKAKEEEPKKEASKETPVDEEKASPDARKEETPDMVEAEEVKDEKKEDTKEK